MLATISFAKKYVFGKKVKLKLFKSFKNVYFHNLYETGKGYLGNITAIAVIVEKYNFSLFLSEGRTRGDFTNVNQVSINVI